MHAENVPATAAGSRLAHGRSLRSRSITLSCVGATPPCALLPLAWRALSCTARRAWQPPQGPCLQSGSSCRRPVPCPCRRGPSSSHRRGLGRRTLVLGHKGFMKAPVDPAPLRGNPFSPGQRSPRQVPVRPPPLVLPSHLRPHRAGAGLDARSLCPQRQRQLRETVSLRASSATVRFRIACAELSFAEADGCLAVLLACWLAPAELLQWQSALALVIVSMCDLPEPVLQ